MTNDVPEWFRMAMGAQRERLASPVRGGSIEILAWGRQEAPGILFVPGMLAHAGWWAFIAPLLADEFRCAALSFSGMGQSEWRDLYSVETYCEEMAAAIAAAGLDRSGSRPIIVAHSFGGFPARRFAESHGPAIGGLVLVDSEVRDTNEDIALTRTVRDMTCYSSVDEAVSKFRLKPPQPCRNAFLVEYVARTGLRHDPDGWRWTFDPEIRRKLSSRGLHAGLKQPSCSLAFIWGEYSLVMTSASRNLIRTKFPEAPVEVVPGAGHHVMLDEPQRLLGSLRRVIDKLGDRQVGAASGTI
jgi:pimeloyl-ACP methyl ester carboxylesterase